MGNKTLTTKIIILRKKLAVLPIGVVPVLGFFFHTAGGGAGASASSMNEKSGFDITVPKSETEEIVDSKKEAYNERESYMEGFNTDVVPEIELENKTSEVWTEEKKDDFNAQSDLLSLYENHNSTLDRRRQEVRSRAETYADSYEPVATTPKKKVSPKVETTEEPMVDPIVNDPAPVQERKSLFHDNNGRANDRMANSKTNSNTEIKAVIHGNQEIGGSRNRVKLRTKSPGMVNGISIPANTIVYANASITENRLNLVINNISVNNKTIGLSMKVYDATDGNAGLNLSAGVTEEEKNRMGSEVIRQGGAVLSSGGIVGAVVNSAGSALGNIFSKSNQNSSIQLISNHQVILK